MALPFSRVASSAGSGSWQMGPRDPKPWMWSVTDPELAGRPGWANTNGEMPSRRQAMDRLIERWQELRVF